MKNNSKALATLINDGAEWLRGQVGKSTRQDKRDKIEKLIVSALMCLSQSPDWPRYKAWISRHKAADAIRNRQTKFVIAKWNRVFRKLLQMAASDLESLPGFNRVGTPLGLNDSPAQLSRRVSTPGNPKTYLAEPPTPARSEAILTLKVGSRIRTFDLSTRAGLNGYVRALRSNRSNHTSTPEAENLTPFFKGSTDPKIATFTDLAKLENSRSAVA